MAKLFLFAFGMLLWWGYRNVRLAPKRPRGGPRVVPASKGPRAPHDVLGVAPNATPEQIRRAYHEQIRKHHPDRMVGASEAERRRAEKRTAELNAAYEALCPK